MAMSQYITMTHACIELLDSDAPKADYRLQMLSRLRCALGRNLVSPTTRMATAVADRCRKAAAPCLKLTDTRDSVLPRARSNRVV